MEEKQAEKASEERYAKHKAEREAEAKLMSDPTRASQELEKRLEQWMSVAEGLIFVRAGTTPWTARGFPSTEAWHAIAASTPWFVRCDNRAIQVTLGGWSDLSRNSQNQIDIEPMFGVELSRAPFTDDQCKSMIATVGKKLLSMTHNR